MMRAGSPMAQAFFDNGRLPCPILDFHGHMHEHPSIHFAACDTDGMLKTMDRMGVRWLLFTSHRAMYDPTEGEWFNVAPCRRYPNRLKAYHGVISRYVDADGAIKDVENAPEVYVGFKFLCDYYEVRLSDERHAPLFEYLNATGKPALLHTWSGSPYNGPDEVVKIAERYPSVPLICGHSFMEDVRSGVRQTKACPNIWYELTAATHFRGNVEAIAEEAGTERILFGTDLPWYATSYNVGALLGADITDADRENIFWRNGDRLLSRFDWYKQAELE